LLAFRGEAQLDRVGAFAYSPVGGARANELPDPVPEELKEDRLERFMETQAAISAAKLRDKIGRRLTVLVDEVNDDAAIARSMADAPEIDGVVRIADGSSLKAGQFVDVRVSGASAHDLDAARIVG
jgi:ribosomal protein S12 methylthiotransferase